MYIDRRPGQKSIPLHYKCIYAAGGILLSLLVVKLCVYSTFVSEDAMSPALKKGDVAFFFRFGKPTAGRIVLYRDPLQKERLGVRRVIASQGSSIKISDKKVYVNTQPVAIQFHYTDNRIFPDTFSHRDNMESVRIPDNTLFLMGDNFDQSYDSRQYGPVSNDNIIGVLFWSF